MTDIENYAQSLAVAGVDLGSDEACTRHLHDVGFQNLYMIDDAEWQLMLDRARELRAVMQAERPSLPEYATALLILGMAWIWAVVAGTPELV